VEFDGDARGFSPCIVTTSKRILKVVTRRRNA
jgi:hypothetical protein